MGQKTMSFTDTNLTAAPEARLQASAVAQPCQSPYLRILVIEHLAGQSGIVGQLTEEGYTQVQYLSLKDLQKLDIHQVRPEMLLIECKQVDQQLLTVVELLHHNQLCPSLVISQSPASKEEITQVLEAGACNFIGPENALTCLQTLIETTCVQFQQLQSLQQQLQSLKVRLEDRKQIERAKGLLMKKHQCDEEQAYIALRKLSMNRAQNMGQVARELLQKLE